MQKIKIKGVHISSFNMKFFQIRTDLAFNPHQRRGDRMLYISIEKGKSVKENVVRIRNFKLTCCMVVYQIHGIPIIKENILIYLSFHTKKHFEKDYGFFHQKINVFLN